MKKQALALFDFDGTVTTRDSLPDFIRFAVGNIRYFAGLLMLSPVLLAYLLKIVPNDLAKQRLLSHYFRGWDIKKFSELCRQYNVRRLPKILRSEAIKKIDWHKSKNHKVLIVSASLENWLMDWCVSQRIDLLATRFEIKENTLTGFFEGKNCYGDEKERRIRELLDLGEFGDIYAYGDSVGDNAMLGLANKPFYRSF